MGDLTLGLKAKYSFYAALMFFLVANPLTFRLTNGITSWLPMVPRLSDPYGCPTHVGVFAHTVLFFGGMMVLMLLPNDPPQEST